MLVGRYQAAAYRVAVLLGAGGDAEDVVQDAFVKALRGLRGFRAGQPFRPWLLRIVANETRNLHRSRRRRQGLEQRVVAMFPEGVDAGAGDPHLAVVRKELDRRLWAVLQGLPDKDRLVLSCRYLLDLSEGETARVLGWARGSVKSRTSRALARLRAVLGPDLEEGGWQ